MKSKIVQPRSNLKKGKSPGNEVEDSIHSAYGCGWVLILRTTLRLHNRLRKGWEEEEDR